MSDIVTSDAKLRAFADLQNELAGLDVGRQRRFLPTGYDDPRSDKAREREAQVYRVMTELQRMMMDEDYAALYTRVHTTVSNMELAVDVALEDARARQAESAAEIEALRARAGTLPDGTIVFRSETGEVFTEDGAALAPGMEESVSWQTHSPSWEEYSAAKDKAHAAQAEVDEIETYQREVLQPARDRLEDPANETKPLSAEKMEQIERDVLEQAPSSVSTEFHKHDAPTEITTRAQLPELKL